MAAIMNRKARRLAGLALAISAVAIPGVASADPENGGRGGWHARSEEGGRQERQQTQDNGWQGRQAPQQEQVRQAPVPQAQANWQARADRGDRGSRGNWNGNAAPQAAPAPQPAQQGWNGGQRQDRGNWNRDAQRQQADQARTWNRDGNRDGNWNRDANRDQQPRNWTDAGRQNRDGDRRSRDGDRDRGRNGGYVQGGTWYGSSNGYNRDRRDWDRDGDRDHRNWNRQWRDNSRYNWYSYRSSHPSYYRLGTYYSPYRNYSYRRLSIGFFLDDLFFGQDYWIDDPSYYRLPDVYGPYRWVRYYDDAVLVDIYSGEVVDVIYDFFW